MVEKKDMNQTLNVTIVALVALVSLVAVTAMVLNIGHTANLPQVSNENSAGQAAGSWGLDCEWVMSHPDDFEGTRTWDLCGAGDVITGNKQSKS